LQANSDVQPTGFETIENDVRAPDEICFFLRVMREITAGQPSRLYVQPIDLISRQPVGLNWLTRMDSNY